MYVCSILIFYHQHLDLSCAILYVPTPEQNRSLNRIFVYCILCRFRVCLYSNTSPSRIAKIHKLGSLIL